MTIDTKKEMIQLLKLPFFSLKTIEGIRDEVKEDA